MKRTEVEFRTRKIGAEKFILKKLEVLEARIERQQHQIAGLSRDRWLVRQLLKKDEL